MEKMGRLILASYDDPFRQPENLPPFWSLIIPSRLFLEGWEEKKGVAKDRSLLSPVPVLPDPCTASFFSAKLQMGSFARVAMVHLSQTKRIFPHHNKSQFKAGCSPWSWGEIFFPPSVLPGAGLGLLRWVCFGERLAGWLGLSRKKTQNSLLLLITPIPQIIWN